MNDTVRDSIREHMAKLPRPHQQAINSFDWERRCDEIATSHNLLEAEITGLQAEVALVLLGLSDLPTLHRYIDDEIGGTGWQQIEADIVETVISPIYEIFEIITKYNG